MKERISKLEKEGKKVIDLSIGEPDFDTPETVKKAAIEAIEKNKTHYTSSKGIPELRGAIARHLREIHDTKVECEQIIVAPGAKQALFYVLTALLEEGEEVLVPEPSWLSYCEMIKLAGGIPVPIESSEEEGFIPPIDRIKKMIGKNTRAILINNPVNPTGALYGKEQIKQIVQLCEDKNIYLISDEIYCDIVYGEEFFSAGKTKSQKVILINGTSKMAAMTGWRIGYAIGNKKIIDDCVKMQQQTATCPSSISQYAAVAAFSDYKRYISSMISAYSKRRNMFCKGLENIGIKYFKPKGTFYVFANIKSISKSSKEATEFLLDKAGVSSVPGSAYGKSGEGYVRFSFATSEENLNAAIERMKKALG
jgi:aspartate aminotransferase